MTGELYVSQRVAVPLVEAGVFKSDVLRPNVNPGVTVEGDLHVTGHISYDAILSPYWIAGVFDKDGVVLTQKGRYPFTVSKPSGANLVSAFDVSFPDHPEGANWTHGISSTEYHAFVRDQTQNYYRIWLRQSTNADNFQGEGLTSIWILA